MGDSTIFFKMHVESVLIEVLGHHLARLYDAAFLRQVFLAKVLAEAESVRRARQAGESEPRRLTTSSEISGCRRLPTSFMDQSSDLSFGAVVTPGTTRGIAAVLLEYAGPDKLRCPCLVTSDEL